MRKQVVICILLPLVIITSTYVLKKNADTLVETADAIMHGESQAENKTDLLFNSANQGNVARIQRLLSQGVDVNSKNNDGETPLMITCSSGRIEAAKFLLKHGADIKSINGTGKTPLFYAVVGKDASGTIVSLLLEAGADPNATDYNGIPPLVASTDFGSFENIKALLKGGAQLSPYASNLLHIRISWGDIKTTELLLDSGAEVNSRREDGWTPLMIAAIGGHAEIVQLLLQRGAVPNIRNNDDKTALQLTEEANQRGVQSVAHKRREEIIKTLTVFK